MPTLNDVMEVAELLKNKSVIAMEDHCIAVRNRNASCRKCADACVANVITVASNELTIDYLSCVGCGACAAVCPTACIIPLLPSNEDLAKEVARATNEAQGVSVIACARMAARQIGNPDKFATVPCLGRMEEQFLVELAAHGVRDIALVDGVCSTCKYGAVSPLVDETIASAADLLEMVGCETIITRSSEFPPEVVEADERKKLGASRRSFFSESKTYTKTVAMSATEKAVSDLLNRAQGGPKSHSLKDRLSAGLSGKMPPFEAKRNMGLLDNLCNMGEPQEPEIKTRLFGVMEIDAEKCSGCGMCVMFCPTAAVKYCEVEEPANPEMRYLEFQVADCTNCGLCVDVCLRKCVTMSDVISTAELFDFEPRLIEIPKPPKTNNLFARRGK